MRHDGGGNWQPTPCEFCGAPDSHDAAHAAGCPTLPELSRDELVAIARGVERGWAGDAAFDRMGAALRARGAA